MPELPEVEAIKLGLEKYLVGHAIKSVEVRNAKSFTGEIKAVEGANFMAMRRFGKAIVADLDNGYSLIAHVKMTGQFIYRGPNLENPQLSKKVLGGLGGKHTHVIFHLEPAGELYFNDVRKFGWIKVVKSVDVPADPFIVKLGPEPFGKLDYGKFTEIMQKSKRAVKIVLMDQSKMGGIGNIYANDALFSAKIKPERSAESLSETELKALFASIEKVLSRGIRWGGASENSFVTPDGTEGQYQNHTLVYGKKGSMCPNCGSRIEKFVLGGRGTYWCPNCQK